MEVIVKAHYCKSNLIKGCDHKINCKCKPFIVEDITGTHNVRNWELDLFDGHGNPVRIQCNFGNTTGKAKRSGARMALEVLR